MATPLNTKKVTPLINDKAWDNLLELATDSGDDVVAEIGNAFLTQVQEMGAKFRAAAGNAKGFSELAHNLKSSAGGVGAEALAEFALDWETRARHGELPKPANLTQLDALLAETAEEIRARLTALTRKVA